MSNRQTMFLADTTPAVGDITCQRNAAMWFLNKMLFVYVGCGFHASIHIPKSAHGNWSLR